MAKKRKNAPLTIEQIHIYINTRAKYLNKVIESLLYKKRNETDWNQEYELSKVKARHAEIQKIQLVLQNNIVNDYSFHLNKLNNKFKKTDDILKAKKEVVNDTTKRQKLNAEIS